MYIEVWCLSVPDEGHSRMRDPSRRSRWLGCRARRGHIISPPSSKDACHGKFRSFLLLRHPVRGPRADARIRRKGRFAGPRQLRQVQGRRRDPQRHHRGGVHQRQQGRQRIFRQADGNDEGQHHRDAGFRAGADRREIALGSDGAVDLPRQEAVRDLHRPGQGTRRTEPRRSRPRPSSRSRPAPRSCSSRPPDRSFLLPEKARAHRPGFLFFDHFPKVASEAPQMAQSEAPSALPKRGVAPSFRPVRRPFFGAGEGCSCSSVG